MAFETSSYASSSSQSNDAPKELLQLLGILNKQQQRQIQLPQQQDEGQQQQRPELHQTTHQQKQQQQQQQHVELSQIELIYRAEGNANLVLALPQFKKVLRLPKIQNKRQQQQQQQQHQLEQQYPDRTQFNQKYSQQHQMEQQQQHELKQQEPTNMALTTATGQNQQSAVGILTMDHYVAYIGIIRCLLGNEFVYEADIVAVPNPNDRDWINEHIRPYRPVNRLDKEFGGHYGLLLPDATGLPTEFDILFSNLQQKTAQIKSTTTQAEATREATQCFCSFVGAGGGIAGGDGNNIFGEDTYAIEIKPKQGWLLPNDVNNLFDIKPTTAPTTEMTMPPAADPYTPSEGALKISTDKELFTATQNPASTAVAVASSSSPSPCPPPESISPTATVAALATGEDGEISHSWHGMADIRCRYCSMQHLKLKQQKIVELSNYCPMDLFSGVPSRMLNALQALFMCPQNNLRIFKNGILVYDDKLSRMSKIEELFSSDKLQLIKHLLLSCLLRDYTRQEEDITAKDDGKVSKQAKDIKCTKEREKDVHVVTATGRCNEFCDPHSSMTLCQRQKGNICTATSSSSAATAAVAVITTAEPEVTKVKTTFTTTTSTITAKPSTSTACSSHRSPTSDLSFCYPSRPSTAGDVSVGQMNTPEMLSLPKNCVLQKLLHLQLLAKRNLPYMLDHKYQVKKEKSFDSLRKLLKKFAENANKLETSQLEPDQQYLLAATAMDCSIMITFRSVPWGFDSSLLENPHVICVNGQKFVTKVTLLDLDPKPDSHFAKYCKQTKEIVNVLQKS